MGELTIKKQVFLLPAVCFILAATSAYLFAEEGESERGLLEDTPIEVSSDVAAYSKYIWRGIKLDDDSVLQSGVYLSGYGVEASIWGSVDIDGDDALNSDEVDYSVGYTYSLEKQLQIPLSISGGFTYYDFPAADVASREFYVGAGMDVLLSPAVTWYHDFGEENSGGGDGDYIVGELSHSFPIPNMPASLDLSGHVGYNNEFFIRGGGGDVGLRAALTFQLIKNGSLSPSVNYSIPFGDLEDSNDGNQDDEFYGGGVLIFSF